MSLTGTLKLYDQLHANTVITQKMKFSIKDFFSKCDQIRTFTEEILNGKLHFLCSVINAC